MTAPPPCADRHALFDSVHPRDHAEARALCHRCHILDACRRQLDVARANAYGSGPRGTWAGLHFGYYTSRHPEENA